MRHSFDEDLSLKKGVGPGPGSRSESISQKYGSADPDQLQNVTDPEHWFYEFYLSMVALSAGRSLENCYF